MKLLVTGATSLIGKEVVKLLLNSGHAVRIISRKKNNTGVFEKTEAVTGDLCDAANELAEGIDVVIHIAAATPGAGSSTEEYYKTNRDGTKQLVKICEKNNVRRFIHISSIVVLYDKNRDDYTESKRQAEKIVCESRLNWTILRPAEILGADKSWNNFLQLLKNKKVVFVPGEGSQLRHPVFFNDVVNAILQVTDNVNTYNKKYTLAAAEAVSYYRFLLLVKNIYDLNFRIVRVPMWVIGILTFFKPVMPEKVKRKINNAYGMLQSIELDIKESIADFNYTPSGVEEGLRDLKKDA
jgi:nucleoside-diphosphate-sugar epimerase